MTMYDKIAQMKPEQKNHWFEIPELSYWGERFFAEFSVAEALAEEAERPLLEQAIDELYGDFCRNHALTDDACRRAEERLLPFSSRAKAYRLHCVAHAHIDMDWMWGLHETVDTVLATFRTMLDLMDAYPTFTFSQSQCAVYRLTEFYDPALFRRLQARVEEGRFEFAGSAFVELDKNMPNLESMARHILYTKRYLHDRFGIPFEDVNLDFHPDSFGHSGSVPEILRAGGIRFFYHCRGLDGEYLYRWRGYSGAEVLALNEPLWYNDAIRPMYLGQVPRFCGRYGIRDMMKIYGVGDHGGGPTRMDIERILDMQTWPVAPTIFFSTYRAYFAAIEPFMDRFPVVTGELGPTFTGCYTSQSKEKLANRIGEDRLYLAEALTAFAAEKTGADPFRRQFRFAWEKLLFNQFHDILPGSNTPESKDHAWGAFEEAMGSVMAASGASLRAFAQAMDTSGFETPFEPLTSRSEGGGTGLGIDQKHRFRLPAVERGRGLTRLLHIFNPTGFDREQVLDVSIWDWPGDPARLRVRDTEGNLLPCAAATDSHPDWSHSRTDVQLRLRVPALGYTTVQIDQAPKERFSFCELPPDPRVTYYKPLVLENDRVRVVFREEDLSIAEYLDKGTGKVLLTGGHFLHGQERAATQTVRGGCAWVEGVTMDPVSLHHLDKAVLCTPVTDEGLRQSLRYELRWGLSVLQVRASLDMGSPILELAVTARFLEASSDAGTPRLVFRAELAQGCSEFRTDGQTGTVQRSVGTPHDWCGRDFAFAPGAEGLPGVALLTDSKYGYRCDGKNLEVSLLRASSRPDPYPELGERSFRLGLSAASDDPMALKALGSLFTNRDLPYVSNYAHPGTLPLAGRFLSLSGPAVVGAIKTPEEGEGLIVRLYCPTETGGAVTLSAPGLRAAWLTDLNEQVRASLPLSEGELSLDMGPQSVATVRLEFAGKG